MLEYVPGGELFQFIRGLGRFPLSVAKFYAAELLITLDVSFLFLFPLIGLIDLLYSTYTVKELCTETLSRRMCSLTNMDTQSLQTLDSQKS